MYYSTVQQLHYSDVGQLDIGMYWYAPTGIYPTCTMYQKSDYPLFIHDHAVTSSLNRGNICERKNNDLRHRGSTAVTLLCCTWDGTAVVYDTCNVIYSLCKARAVHVLLHKRSCLVTTTTNNNKFSVGSSSRTAYTLTGVGVVGPPPRQLTCPLR